MSARPGVAQRSHVPERPVLSKDWQADARCAGSSVEFHCDCRTHITAAKQVCVGCPVQSDCLEYALARNEQGVWGGMGDYERIVLRSSRQMRAAVR